MSRKIGSLKYKLFILSSYIHSITFSLEIPGRIVEITLIMLMGKAKTILVILITALACRQKNMSLADLEKAKWDSLDKGIFYISKYDDKGLTAAADSLDLRLRGMSGKDIASFRMSLKGMPSEMKQLVSDILKQRLQNSRSGYLKINFSEMLTHTNLTGRIYLEDDYLTSASYLSDSVALKDIDEIKSFRYISKDEAKKEYLANENQDWNKVLDTNPLPASIEIILQEKDWTEESINQLKNKIQGKIEMADEISIPNNWSAKPDDYFFFEYKRIKII